MFQHVNISSITYIFYLKKLFQVSGYKNENEVKTYHNLQPRRHQQNHPSVKNVQQNAIYPVTDLSNSKNSTYNYYQANRSCSATTHQMQYFFPQSKIGHYNGQNNPVNYQQYHGFGQMQLTNQLHRPQSHNSLQASNG